jgi:hypothetical protein
MGSRRIFTVKFRNCGILAQLGDIVAVSIIKGFFDCDDL